MLPQWIHNTATNNKLKINCNLKLNIWLLFNHKTEVQGELIRNPLSVFPQENRSDFLHGQVKGDLDLF